MNFRSANENNAGKILTETSAFLLLLHHNRKDLWLADFEKRNSHIRKFIWIWPL